MLFFACCNTQTKKCVDPVVTKSTPAPTPVHASVLEDSSGSAPAAMGGFSTTDMTIAVATSAIIGAGVGATVFAIMRQKTSNSDQEQAAALQMTLMTDSPHSL